MCARSFLLSSRAYDAHPATTLLQHYGVRKAAGYEEPIANKEALLLVNGLRAWHARPVFSTDEHGADKHKMERFLHEGRCVGLLVCCPSGWCWHVGRHAAGCLAPLWHAFCCLRSTVGFPVQVLC